jgi:sulfur-oxidizing protein SoxA
MRARSALVLLVACLAAPAANAEIPAGERRSGFDFMGPQTQAMQRDDAANPGMLFVFDGEALWRRPAGPDGRSCASCHEEGSMRGVAARHPAFDAGTGRPVDLGTRVNLCRTARQGSPAFAPESPELLALTAYLGLQSRGMPVTPPQDPRLDEPRERGRALFTRRMGQLGLSCAACHDDNWDRRLAGAPVTQGHPTGYPVYRLEWQGLGSVQRRLRNCLTGMRAEPFPPGAPEMVELELYLQSRAAGMSVETPAVRP